jgi:hypothetical protein
MIILHNPHSLSYNWIKNTFRIYTKVVKFSSDVHMPRFTCTYKCAMSGFFLLIVSQIGTCRMLNSLCAESALNVLAFVSNNKKLNFSNC